MDGLTQRKHWLHWLCSLGYRYTEALSMANRFSRKARKKDRKDNIEPDDEDGMFWLERYR